MGGMLRHNQDSRILNLAQDAQNINSTGTRSTKMLKTFKTKTIQADL